MQNNSQVKEKNLRLWPGIAIVIIQWILWYILPAIDPETIIIGVFGGLAGGLAIFVWWGFFSRAPRIERWAAIVVMILTLIVTSRLTHKSILTGMQGMMFFVYAIPVLSFAFVIWALVTRELRNRLRRITMVSTILIACGMFLLLRSGGITGNAEADFMWRWTTTHEEELLARNDGKPAASSVASALTDTEAEWPGFRGPGRDGIIHGIQIKTDWSASPPVELWRKSIGPGCSSCAVQGDFLFTQEQRGEYEIVSCYNLRNGKPVWMHRDSTRFWDSHAGAGPRATPTLSNGRVYSFGATGILNVLHATDGKIIWSANAASDTKTKTPGWGFTSSPLVIDDIVIVAVAGTLAAYDIDNGEIRWFGPDGGDSYSSPHLLTIDGIKQVVMLNGAGATSFSPNSGDILWKHSWSGESRIVQPAQAPNGDVLISDADGSGIRRIRVTRESGEWKVNELWTSRKLKPNFNDFVIHKGYAYGYVGPGLACIDIANGKGTWKEGRYGGQIILLADQDILLVISEEGELALIDANPHKFEEFSRFSAIQGKTWNHPVLAGDILIVRNSREMAAFKLSLM